MLKDGPVIQPKELVGQEGHGLGSPVVLHDSEHAPTPILRLVEGLHHERLQHELEKLAVDFLAGLNELVCHRTIDAVVRKKLAEERRALFDLRADLALFENPIQDQHPFVLRLVPDDVGVASETLGVDGVVAPHLAFHVGTEGAEPLPGFVDGGVSHFAVVAEHAVVADGACVLEHAFLLSNAVRLGDTAVFNLDLQHGDPFVRAVEDFFGGERRPDRSVLLADERGSLSAIFDCFLAKLPLLFKLSECGY